MKKLQCRHFPPWRVIVIGLGVIGACANIFAGPPSYDVPLGNPVYDYLTMLAFPGRVGDISLSCRPYTEAQVCTLLVYAEQRRLCADTAIGHFYLRQFTRTAEGRTERIVPGRLPLDGWHTYVEPYLSTSQTIQDSNFSAAGFTDSSVDNLSKKRESVNRSAAGIRLYSTMGDVVTYFDGVILTEYSSLEKWFKTSDPHTGSFYATILSKRDSAGHFIGYDDFTAYMKFHLSWADLKIGNDRVQWGYADSSGLLFSGIGKPFLQVKLDKSFGKLNYEFLIGKLIGDSYDEDRIVYAKHIAYTPLQWLSFGYSDMEVSDNHEFEPLYCMPVLPLYFAGHYLGDPDNLLMSFDANALIGSRYAAYGELVIDDLENLTGFFTNNDYGDKWGGLFGIKVFNPLPWLPVSLLRAEIVQIEPWVYTTATSALQKNFNYPINFGQVLGSPLGPHSREITLDLSGRFSAVYGGGLSVRQIWKGEGPGSGVFDSYNPSPSFSDTLSNGTVLNAADLADKSYRFSVFDRDRTVLTVTFYADPSSWLRLNANASLAHELKPSSVNLYQAGAGVQFNY